MKQLIKSRFPRLWQFARTTYRLGQLIPRVYGFEPRSCLVCGYQGHFYAEIHLPDIFTYDAICPACSSNTRNRLLKYAVDTKALIPAGARVLHFAPEPPVTRFVKPLAGEYKTADLFAAGVDLKLNIEAINQPDGAWDVIICSHVLEHVDHIKALAEMRRILAPRGVLLAFFPVVEAWPHDYENPEITSERDRGLHFGKEDHLRRFGSSVRKAFTAAGFTLETFAPIGPEVVQFGFIPGETLYIAGR
jgi:SAM-dependent methyltransferase